MKYLLQLFFLLLFNAATTDVSGQPYFTRALQVASEIHYECHITTTYDGGSLLLSTTLDQQSNTSHLNFTKLDQTATVQWTKQLTSVLPSTRNIVQSPDSGYFTCYTSDTLNLAYSAIKLNKNGGLVFHKQFIVPSPYALVSAPNVIARNNGNFYVASTIFNTNTSAYVWHVTELDGGGNTIWSKCYNLTLAKTYVRDIDTCENGDLIVLGRGYSTTIEPMLARIDTAGTLVWAKNYPASTLIDPWCVVAMPGDYFVFASTLVGTSGYQETTLMQADSSGNSVWSYVYASVNKGIYPKRLTEVEGNQFVLTASLYPYGEIIKVDSAGNVVAARFYPDWELDDLDRGNSSTYSLSGRGFFQGSVGYLRTSLVGAGCNDTALVVNKANFPVTSNSTTGEFPIAFTSIAVLDPLINIAVTNTEYCSIVGIAETVNSELQIYPQPSSETIHVTAPALIVSLRLYDATGKVVSTQPQNNFYAEVDVSTLTSGMYLLSVEFESHTEFRRVLIE